MRQDSNVVLVSMESVESPCPPGVCEESPCPPGACEEYPCAPGACEEYPCPPGVQNPVLQVCTPARFSDLPDRQGLHLGSCLAGQKTSMNYSS